MRPKYQRRVWLAFAGFVLSMVAVVFALGAKWFECSSFADVSAVLLLMGFALGADTLQAPESQSRSIR